MGLMGSKKEPVSDLKTGSFSGLKDSL